MTIALARSLLSSGAVSPEALAQALFTSTARGTSLVRALLATRALDARTLGREIERGQAPFQVHVTPVAALMDRLPPGLCERLLAVPVARDPMTGAIDVAVVDANDSHAIEEVAYWLNAPVRIVQTSLAAFDAAFHPGESTGPGAIRPLAPPMSEPRGPSGPLAVEPGTRAPMVTQRPPAAILDLSPEPILDLIRRKRQPFATPEADVFGPARVTERGPFGATAPVLAPALADTEGVMDKIRDARDRDALLDLVVEGIRTVARRVAVFANKRDGFVGWTCTPELGNRVALRAVRLPSAATPGGPPGPTSVLSGAMAHREARLTHIPRDAVHASLLALMNPPPSAEVAVVALRVEGKGIAVVLADQLWDKAVALRRIDEIALVAAQTLGRLLRERRK